MKNQYDEIQAMIYQFTKLMNLFAKLEKIPFDFGTGEMLFPSKINMIDTIGKNQGNTVTEICHKFGITKGAVSQVISELVQKGYVNKERSIESGKEFLLSLTAKGQSAFDHHVDFHKVMDAELAEYLSEIPAEQLAGYQKIFTIIEKHLEKYIDLKENRK